MEIIYPDRFQKNYEEALEYWDGIAGEEIKYLNTQQSNIKKIQKTKEKLGKACKIALILAGVCWIVFFYFLIKVRLDFGRSDIVRDITISKNINIFPIVTIVTAGITLITLLIILARIIWGTIEKRELIMFEYYIDNTMQKKESYQILNSYKFFVNSQDMYKEHFYLSSYYESIYKFFKEITKHNIKQVKAVYDKKNGCLDIISTEPEHPFNYKIKFWNKYSPKTAMQGNKIDFRFLDKIGFIPKGRKQHV